MLNVKKCKVLVSLLDGEKTPIELSRICNMANSWIYRVIKEFEYKELVKVEYKHDKINGNYRVVKLTKKGRKVAEHLKEILALLT